LDSRTYEACLEGLVTVDLDVFSGFEIEPLEIAGAHKARVDGNRESLAGGTFGKNARPHFAGRSESRMSLPAISSRLCATGSSMR
jgi:hypothetical protein